MPSITGFFKQAAVSLQYRNMRLYCSAVLISLIGSMMQESMIAWLAYQITGSTAVLGKIMSFFMLPMIAASIPGGWLSDRLERKKIVLATQFIALLIASAYLFMAASGTFSVPAVYALSALLGVTVAFEMSARMAMLPQLVDNPAHIGNAFALDSLIFYFCRLLGPALGALFLALSGPVGGFAANACSYAFELFVLYKLVPASMPRTAKGASLQEAFCFAYGDRRRRRVLLFLALTTFFGVYIQLMPAFTAMRQGGAFANAFLILASEIGAVLAALFVANKTGDATFVKLLRKSLGWAGVLFSVCFFAFAITTNIWLSLLLMLPTGFAMSLIFAGSQALLQSEVEDRMRGAFTAVFYNFSYFGMLALGGPLLGYLADYAGLAVMAALSGVVSLLVSIAYLAGESLD
ncbi:MAG: MFS transporter [Candidatus Obscuribacterales bacterium]|nr:MFS transporter [Candidatus Obscuribacterales bacterium]